MCVCVCVCGLDQAELYQSETRRSSQSGMTVKWQKKSSAIRQKMNIPREARPWAGRAGVTMMGIPHTPRAMDVLDLGYARMRERNPTTPVAQLVSGLWANPAAQNDRFPVSYSAPTPSTNTTMYSYEHDRGVSPVGVLQLLGWPAALIPSSFSDRELRKLAGNSYSAPLVAMLTAVLIANPSAPWWVGRAGV